MASPGARLVLAARVLALLAALVFAAGQQSASAAAPAGARRATDALRSGQKPSFVVIQTDDQTIDQLYATSRRPAAAPIPAMPNTLPDRRQRASPSTATTSPTPSAPPRGSACSPAATRTTTTSAATSRRTAATPASTSACAYTHNLATWLQGAGYRTIHIGKFLNGYGDEPYDNGTDVPPGWSAWHTVLNSDTDHYFYGYTLNNNGVIEGPYGDSGSWDTREYGERDDSGCPFAPLNGKPCLYETDVSTASPTKRCWARPPEQPFYLQLDYTSPHGDFRRPAGPGAGDPPLRLASPAPAARTAAPEGFNEGNVNDKPRFIREAALPLADRNPHLPRLLPEGAWSRCARSTKASSRSSTRSARCGGCATPTSSSPPTTASSSASTG